MEKPKTEPGMEEFLELGGNINYTDIPKRKANHGVIGESLTKMNFDKSTILRETILKDYENDYKLLFGEFQVAFISFLMGESLDSFTQWKNLFILLTSCDEWMNEKKELFIDFIRIICYFHLFFNFFFLNFLNFFFFYFLSNIQKMIIFLKIHSDSL